MRLHRFSSKLLVASSILVLWMIGMPATAETRADDATLRWLPDACHLALQGLPGDPGEDETGHDETAEAKWNRNYRRGIDAFQAEDYAAAEIAHCRALRAARSFGPKDLRFAETLDELGLLFYVRGDLDRAEAMQGAAVTERLLAVGAPEEGSTETEASACLSSVATYVSRLGWIFERQGQSREIEILQEAPYRILERRYIPDRVVLERIDELISTYLLVEKYAAADWLTAWRDELRRGGG